MNQAPHRYPVGVQVFEDIRTGGYLYADKTGYIWDLVQAGGKYRFLSRPRRFGKTLLVSTMEAYFQGRKDLFRGLALERLDAREEWPAHPVLRLDLSDFKGTEEWTLKEKFDGLFGPYEELYGIEEPAEPPGSRLNALIRAARATPDGANGVVVLVDEYDAPLLNVMHDPERLQRFREVMREFYSPLKKNEANLAFLFITGISKFSQLSIFSELNNLTNVSMLPRYGGICGITAEELDGPLAPDVVWFAAELGVEPAECRQRLRDMYDGYRFTREPAEIYNPFSLVSSFGNGEIAPYWFGSGTPTSLVNMLRRSDVTLPELESVEASASSFDAPTEGMADVVPLMYQSGYLTIKSYDSLVRMYKLGIPNDEVAEGLSRTLLPFYTGRSDVETDGFVARFSRSLLSAGSMDAALRELRSFLAGVPYDLAAKNEKAFQAQLYVVFKLVGASVRSEVRTATGRIDVVIEAPQTTYVMELKYRRAGEKHPTSADALAQIDSRGYLVPFERSDTPVVRVGVVYSEEARTIDEDWAIAPGATG